MNLLAENLITKFKGYAQRLSGKRYGTIVLGVFYVFVTKLIGMYNFFKLKENV